jgi:hypothetical protein
MTHSRLYGKSPPRMSAEGKCYITLSNTSWYGQETGIETRILGSTRSAVPGRGGAGKNRFPGP